MAPNDRAERRQMRQRGAGLTNVPKINFGFTIGELGRPGRPSPLPAQRSSRPTPNRLPPQLSARSKQARTPAQKAASSSKASGSVKQTPRHTSSGRKAPQTQQAFKTPTVTGKRKRPQSAVAQEEDPERDELEEDDPAHRTWTGRSRVSILPSVAERHPEPEDNGVDDLAEADNEHALSSIHSNIMGVAAAERRRSQGRKSHGTLNLQAKGRTPKRRESVATWLFDQSRVTPVPPAVPPSVVKSIRTTKTPLTRKSLGKPRTLSGKQSKRRPTTVNEDVEDEDGEEEEGDQATDELSPELRNKSRRKSQKQARTETQVEENDDDEIEDELSPEAHRLKPRREPRFETEDEDEASNYEEAQSVPPKIRSPSKIKSLPQAARTKQRQKLKSAPKPQAPVDEVNDPEPRQRKGKGDAVPITVYRLSNASKLMGESAEDDGDPLRNPNLASISGVNAVDVLFQITGELADRQQHAITRHIQLSADERQRSELKRKRTMLDMFKNQLSDRLFELTEAVNTGTVLRKRLKVALKKRVDLTDELLSIRKQREEQQMTMDATRDRHDASVQEHEKHDSLNTSLHDIELAINRGRQAASEQGREDEGPQMSLEMLLRHVGSEVSSQVAGGGLLDRTRALNGLLENTAKVLEGRR